MLSPLCLPAAAALSFFLWPAYARVFGAFDKVFSSIWDSLSFSATSLTPDAIKASQEGLQKAQNQAANAADAALWAQNLLGVLLGFLLLIYISKALEWAIYKAKL